MDVLCFQFAQLFAGVKMQRNEIAKAPCSCMIEHEMAKCCDVI
jgi:hypothetical protein